MKVLIIGAGPSGTSCAIQLCKAGFTVTMIDIVTFPRFRPGESCHPGIESLLKQLGVWQDILAHDFLRYNSTVVNHEGKETEQFFDKQNNCWQGFQFPRETFDKILLDKAISLGAKFIPQTKTLSIVSDGNTVSAIITDKGEYKFDFLIDATGSKSLTSIKLGLQREKHSNPIISNYCQIFTTENLPLKLKSYFEITSEFWGYISLIKPNTYSITYSSKNSSMQIDKNLFLSRHFIEPYSEIISKSFETSWSITNNNKFENLYLVGDALMTFDPTSSKGIIKSIMTGIYAAYILDNVKTNKLTKTQGSTAYQKWSYDFFEKELASIKRLLPETMVENVFI
jgi:flavin-dependent dehydrogenase